MSKPCIVLAPNAFKESLSAPLAAQAMREGVCRVAPGADTRSVPLADGGDGTVDALVSARQGERIHLAVNGPLMRKTDSHYGLIDEGKTAVIEMALASGLWMLAQKERNPLKTTTYGTGELIRDALDRGVERIVIGIGGSATTDGGVGMAEALGYRFYDNEGEAINPVGGETKRIARIDESQVHARLAGVQIDVACDVTNPLLGERGAAMVFGPQKGATPAMVEHLEHGLTNLAQRWQEHFGQAYEEIPGAGAAGGLGAGLIAFCGAQLQSGFDLIARYAGLHNALQGAELVITGEGKIDGSTRYGKVPFGVAQAAQALGVPVVAVTGYRGQDATELHDCGLHAILSVVPGPVSLSDAMNHAYANVADTCEQLMRLWLIHHPDNR